MIKKVSILLILLHQFFYAKLQPAQNFVITQYNEVDGISSKSVSDILQSKQGYLWLSTYEGLIRFDGYVFKTYRNTGNSSAFAKIAEDKEGNLWMVLNNGTLAKFNPATESFTNITIKYPALKAGEKAGSAECIFIDNENTLWLGVTRTGFVQINKETGEAVIHNIISENDNYYTPELRKFYNRVLAVYEDADQILWMATPDGLYTLNKRNEQLTHITKRPAKNNVNWRDDNYRTLLAAGNKLYIGCWGGGLTVYDRKSGSFENYKFNTENFNSYTNNIIHSLVAVNDSTIFIASPDKGLLSFNINTKKFTYYSGNKNYSSIPLWLWKKIIKDRDNNIWALNENGLMQLHLPTYKFNFNPFPVTHTDNHIFYSISAVLDEEKYRFVGTSYADGLHIINKKNNTATIVRDETAPGEEDISTILKVYRDKLKNLWVLGKDYVLQETD